MTYPILAFRLSYSIETMRLNDFMTKLRIEMSCAKAEEMKKNEFQFFPFSASDGDQIKNNYRYRKFPIPPMGNIVKIRYQIGWGRVIRGSANVSAAGCGWWGKRKMGVHPHERGCLNTHISVEQSLLKSIQSRLDECNLAAFAKYLWYEPPPKSCSAPK